MVVFIRMKRTMFMMLAWGEQMRNDEVKIPKSIKRVFPSFSLMKSQKYSQIYVRKKNVLGAIKKITEP